MHPESPGAARPSRLLSILALAISAGVQGQSQPKLAVLEFEVQKGLDVDRRTFSARLQNAALRAAPNLFVMTQANIEMLVRGAGRTLEQCESQCVVDTGRLIGADVVISGRISRVGHTYAISIQMYDVAKGELIGGEDIEALTEDELLKASAAAAERLLTPLRTRSPSTSPAPGTTAVQPAPGARPQPGAGARPSAANVASAAALSELLASSMPSFANVAQEATKVFSDLEHNRTTTFFSKADKSALIVRVRDGSVSAASFRTHPSTSLLIVPVNVLSVALNPKDLTESARNDWLEQISARLGESGRARALVVFDKGNAMAGDFTLTKDPKLELHATFMKAGTYSETDYCCVVHGATGISTTGVKQPGGNLRVDLIP